MPGDAVNDQVLREILALPKTIAVVGASPKPGRVSRAIMGYLMEHGYRVVAVNPTHAGEKVFGQTIYANLAEVPEPIDIVDIFRRTDKLGEAVDEALALKKKPKVVWMQLGLSDEAAAKRAQAAGITAVMDRCIKIEHTRLGL